MFYRRKLLLSLFQKGETTQIEKVNVQLILFLITQKQEIPCFDFVLYKSVCFSFLANKDLEVLSHHYLLLDNKETYWNLKKSNTQDYFNQLKDKDKEIVTTILKKYDIKDTVSLTKGVYDSDPYFTIFSEHTLEEVYRKKRKYQKRKIRNSQKQLFSIGYEGRSIDGYLNTLIKNNIKALCDIRKNPLSMKYGFSKNQLMNYCKELDIKYIPIPDLGIDSHLRKNLTIHEKYHILFKKYRMELKTKNELLQKIHTLFNTYNRIAVTCFEKDHTLCHRNSLIEYYNEKIEEIDPIHL